MKINGITTIQDLAKRIDILTNSYSRISGNSGIGFCPVHDDKDNRSLGFRVLENNEIVLKCFRGCSYKDIFNAINGIDSNYSTYEKTGRKKKKDKGIPPWEKKIEAVYKYTDKNGVVLFEKIRFVGKEFNIRVPSIDSIYGYKWGMNGVKPVLYNLRYFKKSNFICIVEGEKDADFLLKKWGICATCNFDGGSYGHKNKWLREYNNDLTGKKVFVMSDYDDAGISHASGVLTSLKQDGIMCYRVELPNLPYKGDISLWAKFGYTKKDFIDILKKTLRSNKTYERK